MHTLGLPYSQLWIALALALFVLTGAVLAAGVVAAMARRAHSLPTRAPAVPRCRPSYHRVMRWWFWLGWPAFLSVLAIFWLMVMKPA